MVCRCLLIALAACLLPVTGWGQTGPDIWDGATNAAGFSGGDGNQGTPYEISSGAELAYLAKEVNKDASFAENKYFKLTKDIDLANHSWIPIGTESQAFKGNFDGNNHTISNLHVSMGAMYAGLFGNINNESNSIEIKNLGIAFGSIGGGESGSVCYTGGIAGNMSGAGAKTIRNCFVTGDLISRSAHDRMCTGGLIGTISDPATIKYCYAAVKTIYAQTDYNSGGSLVGGLVGEAYLSSGDITVQNCISLCGGLSASATESGGPEAGNLVGYADGYGGTITYTDCFSSPFAMHTLEGYSTNTTIPAGTSSDKNGAQLTPGNFNADHDGALNGWADQGWTVHADRLPTLDPDADSPQKGEFVWEGDGNQGTPYQIKSEAQLRFVSFNTNAGSPSYHDKHYKLMNSIELTSAWTPIKDYAATFDGNGYVISGLSIPQDKTLADAGLFDILKTGASVKNLGVEIKDNIVATAKAGGIAAESEAGATVAGCFVAGGTITGQFAGGIVGSNAGEVDGCYTTSGVIGGGSNNAEAGGICGKNLGEIKNCYSISTISGTATNADAGGIAGTNGSKGKIHDCAALNIEGITGAGTGVVTRIAKDNSGTFADNYASFLIPGTWVTTKTADGVNGLGWDGGTFPAGFDTEWNMTGDKLPRLNVYTDRSTLQPADNLLKSDYRTHAITLTQPAEGGTITATPASSPALVSDKQNNIKANTVITLENNPKSDYQLKHYTIAGAEITGNTYTVAADGTLSAVFAKLHTVTVTQPAVGGTFTASYPPDNTLSAGASKILDGTELTLTPTPDPGYRLAKFTANGVEVSSPYTVTGDVTLSAEFELKPTPPIPPEPTVYHTVTLPAVEGAATDPAAGEYEVEAWSSFRFYLTLAEEYDKSEPVVTTDRGETILPRSSDGAYIVKYVRQPVGIRIDGIVKNPDPVNNETIEADAIKVWTSKGNLHISTVTDQTVQVYSLTGLLVKQAGIPTGDTCWQLPAGIYIVRIDNQRYKVIL